MPPPRAASWCRPQAGRHCNALEFFLLNWSLISGWDPVMQALAALTGGRAFDARNTGKSGLPLVFKEIRGYQ